MVKMKGYIMTSVKNLLIIVLVLTINSIIFTYDALGLKSELILIDQFAQELRLKNSLENSNIADFLEKSLLGNTHISPPDHAAYIHEGLPLSNTEVLAIVRILENNISFDAKKAGILHIMLLHYQKEAQVHGEEIREEVLDEARAQETEVRHKEKEWQYNWRRYLINGFAAFCVLRLCYFVWNDIQGVIKKENDALCGNKVLVDVLFKLSNLFEMSKPTC